jgi:hypothetical protein
MSVFTQEEIEQVAAGGNIEHNSRYMARHTARDMQIPDGSDVHKLRDFIKMKYVDKRWFSDTPSARGSESISSAPPAGLSRRPSQLESRADLFDAGVTTANSTSNLIEDRGRAEQRPPVAQPAPQSFEFDPFASPAPAAPAHSEWGWGDSHQAKPNTAPPQAAHQTDSFDPFGATSFGSPAPAPAPVSAPIASAFPPQTHGFPAPPQPANNFGGYGQQNNAFGGATGGFPQPPNSGFGGQPQNSSAFGAAPFGGPASFGQPATPPVAPVQTYQAAMPFVKLTPPAPAQPAATAAPAPVESKPLGFSAFDSIEIAPPPQPAAPAPVPSGNPFGGPAGPAPAHNQGPTGYPAQPQQHQPAYGGYAPQGYNAGPQHYPGQQPQYGGGNPFGSPAGAPAPQPAPHQGYGGYGYNVAPPQPNPYGPPANYGYGAAPGYPIPQGQPPAPGPYAGGPAVGQATAPGTYSPAGPAPAAPNPTPAPVQHDPFASMAMGAWGAVGAAKSGGPPPAHAPNGAAGFGVPPQAPVAQPAPSSANPFDLF